MSMMMVSPVMMAAMNPDNYLARKDSYRKPVKAKKREGQETLFSLKDSVHYEPTDPDKALREFYATYGR